MMQIPTLRTNDSQWRFHVGAWLLLLVTLSLAGRLVTRYVYVSAAGNRVAVARSSAENHTQRLQKDAAQWMAPADELAVFISSERSLPHPQPQPSSRIQLDQSLYNRPPPA